MSANSFGRHLVMTCFGESHGKLVGVIVDGCPAGLKIDERDIQRELDKRRPGSTPYSTSRAEPDKAMIVSGILDGYTTGAPICIVVGNRDVDSKPYEVFRFKPRPGHADYPAYIRYGGFNDYRGGGRFSGRITLSFVAAGAVAKKLLETIGIEVYGHVCQIGEVSSRRLPTIDELRKVYENPVRCAIPELISGMEDILKRSVEEGDSIGSMVEAFAFNVPPGLGDPIFHGLDVDIASIMLAIPGVRALSIGLGFEAASMKGSDFIDPYTIVDGRVSQKSNRCGGILGGLSTGNPIHIRVSFRPPSTIGKRVETINLKTMTIDHIEAWGRYDPCIGIRALPVVEGCLAFVIADHCLNQGLIPAVISGESGRAT
ncbi:MAG: chorismate synthase [Nitrososphaerota archaeon]|nr:chorismate synthase [Nitrososphaerota archaeon]